MKLFKEVSNKYQRLPLELRGSIWFLMCSFLQKGISVITTPIFTRILTTSEYGHFSVFSSWMGIVSVFVSLNLYSGVYMQGLVKFDEDRKEFTSSLQGLLFTLTVAWTIVYVIFREFWNQLFGLSTIEMLAMLVLIWSSSVFNFWSQEQRVNLKYKKLVALTLATSILNPTVSIILVLNSDNKVFARIFGMAIVGLAAYTGLFFVHIHRGKKVFSSKFWKYALMFNLPLIPHYLSMTALNSADRIMIGDMVGSSEAGIYNLAYSLAQIMTIFNSALLQTIEPWLYKKIKNNEVKDISSLAYFTFILIATVNILLIALAPEAVKIFAPVQYYDAIYVIPPVSMSVFFSFLYTFFAVFEFYYEKTKYVMIATMGGAMLNIALNYIFIGRFGYMAAGYTTLVCYICFAILHYAFMQKLCNSHHAKVYNIKILLVISIVFVLLGFIFLMTYKFSVLRFGLLIFLIAVILIYRNKIKYFIEQFILLKRAS